MPGLDAVSFPALIIADDGWVENVEASDQLSNWAWSAIKKCNKRRIRIVLFDKHDCAWLVESIQLQYRPNFLARLGFVLLNGPRLRVQLKISRISENPAAIVQEVLLAAINADDDNLTQWTDADDLKEAVRGAASYEALVDALKAKRAI